MFTRADLDELMGAAPPLGVSIFMPTHVLGSETRQDPIRLKNLLTEAGNKLTDAGLTTTESDAFLAPAAALVDDYAFWQHQNHGLALFLDGGQLRAYKAPIALAEHVAAGPGFRVKPLLPVLAADGAFMVLAINAEEVRLFDASRFALAPDDTGAIPTSIGDVLAEPDYENSVQASPVARPHTASITATNAQVYGHSPAEWRKGRLVEFTRRVAAALEARLAHNPVPVVVAADTEIGGHFQKATSLGPLLAGVIDTNPAAMDAGQLHDAAYAIVQPRLDQGRRDAVERFEALHGRRDPRAASGAADVVRAAHAGRVDTLLLAEGEAVWGRYDQTADTFEMSDDAAAMGDDLLEAAAVTTLQHDGDVHLLAPEDMPAGTPAAATLRY